MKKNIIRVSAMLLVVLIMLCPLSVCLASNEIPVDPGIQTIENLSREVIMYYVWYYLRSVGINIEYGELEEFTGEVNDWIEEELLEWLDTVPSVSSIDALLFPWKFFWNPNGYLVGNQSFLDDISDFTNWLITKFGLDNNETNQVQTATTGLGEIVVYSFPVVFTRSSGLTNEFTVLTSDTDMYWTFSGNNTTANLNAISRGAGTVHYKQYNIDTNTVYENRDYQLISYNNNWYHTATMSMGVNNYHLESYPKYTQDQIFEALDDNDTVTHYGGNMYIITNTIAAPTSTEADGTNSIVITPSGNIYTPQDWDGTVHVDNLPAIVSIGSLRDPGIQSVFLPIKAFINTFSDGFGLMTQLIYNMPSEIVGMALAIMGGIIIFGTIRIMKEH